MYKGIMMFTACLSLGIGASGAMGQEEDLLPSYDMTVEEKLEESSAIYEKLMKDEQNNLPRYGSLAAGDELEALGRGVVLLAEQKADDELLRGVYPASGLHQYGTVYDQHVCAYYQSRPKPTGCSSVSSSHRALGRENYHTTHFAILDVKFDVAGYSNAKALIDLSFGSTILWQMSRTNYGRGPFRVDVNGGGVPKRLYVNLSINPNIPSELTLHANEFGYTYVQVKQNGLIRLSALYKPNLKRDSGLLDINLSTGSGGGGTPFAKFSYEGDIGWFKE